MGATNQYREDLITYLGELGLEASEISEDFTGTHYRLVGKGSLGEPQLWREWPAGADVTKISSLLALSRIEDIRQSTEGADE